MPPQKRSALPSEVKSPPNRRRRFNLQDKKCPRNGHRNARFVHIIGLPFIPTFLSLPFCLTAAHKCAVRRFCYLPADLPALGAWRAHIAVQPLLDLLFVNDREAELFSSAHLVMLAVFVTDEAFAACIFIAADRIERASTAVDKTHKPLAELITDVFTLNKRGTLAYIFD